MSKIFMHLQNTSYKFELQFGDRPRALHSYNFDFTDAHYFFNCLIIQAFLSRVLISEKSGLNIIFKFMQAQFFSNDGAIFIFTL